MLWSKRRTGRILYRQRRRPAHDPSLPHRLQSPPQPHNPNQIEQQIILGIANRQTARTVCVLSIFGY